MKKLRVNVTALDIKRGVCSCTECPIARAMRRATNYTKPVWVGLHTMEVGDRFVSTPPACKRFMEFYDSRTDDEPEPKPFSFTLTFRPEDRCDKEV